jgi:FSR family fosmidomycin resistance protein-like MFS transporter
MTEASEVPVRRRRTLAFASATHVWSDLFYALLIPLLPIMREDPALDLSYTEVGLLRTGFGTASVVLQVPAGFLAERWEEFWLLIAGNIWVGAGFLLMAALTSFVPLLAATVLGGLGGGTQHPLATSMVSRAYRDEGHSAAVGTVNFAGDIGKLLAPLVVVIGLGWRSTMRLVGAAGIVFMALSMLTRRSVRPPRTDDAPVEGGSPSVRDAAAPARGLFALGSIGFMDAATRTAALTFVPFVLADRGAGTREVLILLTLLLAGGAAGKYGCGWLDDRYGSMGLVWWTKGVTALLLLAILVTPVVSAPALMLVLGFGLNGTSSVLYAAVARFAPRDRRATTYGYYYTVTEASAIAPLIYGRIADMTNLRVTMMVMAAATALILPASLLVRRHLAAGAPPRAASGG